MRCEALLFRMEVEDRRLLVVVAVRDANQVRELDPPRAISWQPGTEDTEGRLSSDGWTWRYDLAPAADGGTEVRLTYDWSGATPQAREVIAFPPFDIEHLENSLRHLAVLAAA